ncbi:Hypothetical protein D9617_1g083250 [Elsinoe fawcettii]|nr:Hypothetical protein D9617_1g083250 [Elsinoe fawcettii]
MDPWETPYCIWYMSVPAPQIYFALSKKAPQMIDSVLRACIVADYQDLFAALVSTSHPLLLKEAQDSPNPFYMKLLSSLEPHVGPADSTLYKKGKVPTRVRVSEPSALTFVKDVADGDANWEFTHLIYDGIGCNFGAVHLNLILPDTVRSDKRLTDEPKIGLTDFYYDVDYNPWDDYTRHLHGEPPSKGG